MRLLSKWGIIQCRDDRVYFWGNAALHVFKETWDTHIKGEQKNEGNITVLKQIY